MNKLTNCKACGKEISKSAKKCPSCGHDSRNFFKKHKIVTGLLVIAVLVVIVNSGSKGATTTPTATNSTNSTTNSTPSATTPTPTPTPTVPTEYISALAKAEEYGNTMSMSKAGIYDQLTSVNGEKFSAKSAQYAVDNAKIDYNANALKKAQDYQKTMSMSPSAIYDQLTSQNGEKFTASQAKYAQANLK